MILLVLLLAAFLSASAYAAAEEILDVGPLSDELPKEAAEWMEDLSPRELPPEGVLVRFAEKGRLLAGRELRSVGRTAGVMLLVCVLISLANSLNAGNNSIPYVTLAGVAAVGAASLADLDSYLQKSLESLQALSDYSRVLLPVLSTAAAASGSVGAAAGKYAATALMMDVLLSASKAVLIPAICGFAALALADAAVGNGVLTAAKKLIKTVSIMLISGLCMAFTAWISLTGIITGTADSLTYRVTKTVISSALPVVGGILSDAAGSLAAAADMFRGCVGVFGLLAILAVCAGSVLALGVRYLVYRLVSVVCACLSDKRMGDLIRDLGTCFGLMLSLNGAGALMLFISIYSLMRTVTG